ncbi:MAG: amidohydrolase [Balneolaceae bacterium]
MEYLSEEALISLRKTLHQQPDLSGQEGATAALVKKELQKTDPDQLLTGVGGQGMVAIYNGKEPQRGCRVMLRCELDGLPITEETGLDYASAKDGTMHACGHDGHMAILLGVARYLKENRPEKGVVLLVFQPAEETGEGAGWMLNDPAFQELEIDRAFALHNLPGYEENTVHLRNGTFACASVGVDVQFKGSSSHAAHPEQGLNPSRIMAETILELQKSFDRLTEKESFERGAITFVQLGERAFGMNPGSGAMGMTIRAETDEELESIYIDVESHLHRAAERFDGEVSFSKAEPFAATINEDEGVEVVEQAAKALSIDCHYKEVPFGWSEDVGMFREKCPVTLFGLGSGKDHPPLHAATYDFNDRLLATGTKLFIEIIKHYNHG